MIECRPGDQLFRLVMVLISTLEMTWRSVKSDPELYFQHPFHLSLRPAVRCNVTSYFTQENPVEPLRVSRLCLAVPHLHMSQSFLINSFGVVIHLQGHCQFHHIYSLIGSSPSYGNRAPQDVYSWCCSFSVLSLLQEGN